VAEAPAVLSAAIGRTPRTEALFTGAVASPRLRLDLAPVPVISRAFAPMVREGRYDVSEMAIATFLMAKAAGKDLVLLPAVLAARFQEGALLCRTGGEIRGRRPRGAARRRARLQPDHGDVAARHPARELRAAARRDALETFEDATSRSTATRPGLSAPRRRRHARHADGGRAGRRRLRHRTPGGPGAAPGLPGRRSRRRRLPRGARLRAGEPSAGRAWRHRPRKAGGVVRAAARGARGRCRSAGAGGAGPRHRPRRPLLGRAGVAAEAAGLDEVWKGTPPGLA
jgi:hypothetical protein